MPTFKGLCRKQCLAGLSLVFLTTWCTRDVEAGGQGTVAAGDRHTCGVDSAGGLRCWGENGQTKMPQLPAGQTWTAVAAGWAHGGGVDSAGGLHCWGWNGLLQTAVPSLSAGRTWTAVAAGWAYTCGVDSAGGLQCWGDRGSGQTSVPSLPAGLAWAAVVAGYQHTCGVDNAGGLRCWGYNDFGQTVVPSLPAGRSWAVVAAGGYHNCGFDTLGSMNCWGWDGYGETVVPPLPAGQTWAAVCAGYAHTCGVGSAGGLFCWGRNMSGQTAVPQLPAGQTWATVAAGDSHTCGIDGTGGMRCWGRNDDGQTAVPSLPAGQTWRTSSLPANIPPPYLSPSQPSPSPQSPSTPPSPSSSAGAIAGGVVGALAVSAAAVAAFVFWRRKRTRSRQEEAKKSLEDGPTEQQPHFQVQPRSPPPPVGRPPPMSYASTGRTTHLLDSTSPHLFTLNSYSTAATTNSNSGEPSLLGPSTPILDSPALAASGSSPSGGGGTDPIRGPPGSDTSKQQQFRDALGMWEVQWHAVVLGDCIGKGSFGKVYAARWNEAPVAVKRLDDLDTLLSSEPPEMRRTLLDALHAEAGLMAALRHPNIVAFMGMCAAPPAIVTELCARGSLTDVLKAARRDITSLPWPLRLHLAIGAAAGMHHLHCQSPPIVHRDLKSPNLLVAQDWTVKVADFNLSRMIAETTGTLSGGGTMANMNPRWLAPEVLKGGRATVSSDIYSLGMILWELLTLDIPWGGESPARIIYLTTVDQSRPAVPPAIALPGGGFRDLPAYTALMRACWAQEPGARPASFAEVLAALRRLEC